MMEGMNVKVWLAVCAAAVMSCADAQKAPKPRKVLMIGNSFSQSVMKETPKLAASAGLPLDIVQCMIGGCSFKRHWENVEKAGDLSFRPYGIHGSYATDPAHTLPKSANLIEMLTNDVWDVVTIQQASRESIDPTTFHPYADNLIAKIRELVPTAEIVIQETWSYAPYDVRLVDWWKITPAEMHAKLKSAYGLLAAEYSLRTIPTGDAVQLFRERLPVEYGTLLSTNEIAALKEPAVIDFHGDVCGTSEWRQGRKDRDPDWKCIRLVNDFPHLNRRGAYLQACVWLAALFDLDPRTFSYKPDFLSDADARLMRECAYDAVFAPETKRWQAAIDAASANGGGRVTIPAGRHLVGQLDLRNGVELHLEKGCVLEGQYGLENYRVLELPYSEGTWSAIVSGVNVTNVAITGEGVIDGMGSKWPAPPKGFKGYWEGLRPRGVFFAYSKDVRLEDYTLRNSACWGNVFKNCENVTARRVKVFNHGNINNDGFDIEARHVLIEDCEVSSSDDSFCIKSNDPDFIVEDVTIRNCTARGQANCYKIGTATRGIVRNIRILDNVCDVPRGIFERYADGSKVGHAFHYTVYNHPEQYPYGFALTAVAVECVDGGCVEDVVVDGMKIVDGVKIPIFVRADRRKAHIKSVPLPRGTFNRLSNVMIRNLHGYAMGPTASSITGVDGFRIDGVTLENIDIRLPGAGETASSRALRDPRPYRENKYPSPDIFHPGIFPAYGLYVDRADNVRLKNARFRLLEGGPVDLRPEVVFAEMAQQPSERCLRAGFARVDITPTRGGLMPGYFKVREVDGMLDPVEANCVAFSDGEKMALVIALDTVTMPDAFADEARDAIADSAGIERDAIIMQATHTHTGGDLRRKDELLLPEIRRAEKKRLSEAYVAETVAALVRVSKSAITDLRPACLSCARSVAPRISFGRRYVMRDGSVRTNPGVMNPDIVRPAGNPPDEEVQLLRIDRDGGVPLAVINFQTHPDVIGGSKISADWLGFTRRTFEAAMAGNVRCLVLNGAEGDVNHVCVSPRPGEQNGLHRDFDDVERGYEHSRHMGNVVAGAALQVWEKCRSLESGTIRAATRTICVLTQMPRPEDLPEARRIDELHRAGRDAEIPYEGMDLTTKIASASRKLRLENGPMHFELQLSAVAIGNSVAFAGFPGEPFNDIGKLVKRKSPFAMTFLSCLTNASRGYFPSADAYAEGGYEAEVSLFGPSVSEDIVSGQVELLRSLR